MDRSKYATDRPFAVALGLIKPANDYEQTLRSTFMDSVDYTFAWGSTLNWSLYKEKAQYWANWYICDQNGLI